MQLTHHATRRTPHAASCLVQALSSWSVKTRRPPCRHCRDARANGHTIMAMHDTSIYHYPPCGILRSIAYQVQHRAWLRNLTLPSGHPRRTRRLTCCTRLTTLNVARRIKTKRNAGTTATCSFVFAEARPYCSRVRHQARTWKVQPVDKAISQAVTRFAEQYHRRRSRLRSSRDRRWEL